MCQNRERGDRINPRGCLVQPVATAPGSDPETRCVVATGSTRAVACLNAFALTRKLVPRSLAAQAHRRTLTAHYLKHVKHRRPHGLAGQHCAPGINEKASFFSVA